MQHALVGAAPRDPVVASVRGESGHIVLNRPASLNALTHEMVRLIDARLGDWETDPAVTRVVISGAGHRGLCAGGDVVAIYHDARVGGSESRLFWRDEYRMNLAVAGYPKPVVAFMDGIVMGGGVGLSAHASHRVVTENSRVGMPEVGIGFVPDVGGTYLLSRAGGIGRYAALTGLPLPPGDAVAAGLADHFIPSNRLAALVDDLATIPVDTALARHADAPADPVLATKAWMTDAFSRSSVTEILDALDESTDEDAHQAAAAIRAKSPTALVVTLEALKRAANLDLRQALVQEFRISSAALNSADLVEGIRAQLIDKDRAPRWDPPRIDLVTPGAVDRFFSVPETGDLNP